jgi:uncharacterized membrane-anchored protein YitT (DUF2179 family)
MPTAAKLIGGILLTLTALYATFLFLAVKTTMGVAEELYFINGILGFLVGWRSIGRDPGFGGFGSILSGIRGGFLFVMISAVIYGIWVVILKLEKFFIRQFDDVAISWFEETVAYLKVAIQPDMLVALIVGGIISGIGAGLANRYWT